MNIKKGFIRFLVLHGWSQNDVADLFSYSAPRITQILAETKVVVNHPCGFCKKETEKFFDITNVPGVHKTFHVCEFCVNDLRRDKLI